MSDSGDDWENQLDSDNDEKEQEKKKAEEEAKKKEFGEEDTVDTEKIRKEKIEEQKRLDKEAQENGRVKSTKAVDYDKIFRERQAKLAGQPIEAIDEEKTKGMSKEAKGMLMEQAQEKNLVDQLFAGDVDDADNKPPTVILASEKDYKQLGTKVAQALYSGSAPYRIEAFFKELSKDLPQHADSKQIEKISQHFKTMFNQKQKDEKAAAKTKSTKPSLKGANKGADRNNNAAMINDVLGNAEEDEYGDYGEEGFKREGEADYDFM